MKKILLYIICFFLILCVRISSVAQVDMGVQLTPGFENSHSSKETGKKNLKDPFIFYFCKMFNKEYGDIKKVVRMGYGRSELITLAVIEQKTSVSFKDLITERNKLIPLRTIAEKRKINYRDVRQEAKKNKLIIEQTMMEQPVTEEEPSLPKE